MILYLDAGSLLTRYGREAMSRAIEQRMKRADFTATSQVSLVEAAATVRAPRWAGTKRRDLKHALEALEADWSDYLVIGVDERLAAEVAGSHPLGGFGAFHIAAALTAARVAPAATIAFSTLDRSIGRAARAEGFEVVSWDE